MNKLVNQINQERLDESHNLFGYLKTNEVKKLNAVTSIVLVIQVISLLIGFFYNMFNQMALDFFTINIRLVTIVLYILLIIKNHRITNRGSGVLLITIMLTSSLLYVTSIENAVIALISLSSTLILISIVNYAIFYKTKAIVFTYLITLMVFIWMIIQIDMEKQFSVTTREIFITILTIITFINLVLYVLSRNYSSLIYYVYGLVYKDTDSSLFNVHKLKSDVDELIFKQEPFSMIIINISNYDELNKRYHYEQMKRAKLDFHRQIYNSIPKDFNLYYVKDNEYALLFSKDSNFNNDFIQKEYEFRISNDIDVFVTSALGIKCPEHANSYNELMRKLYTLKYGIEVIDGVMWYDNNSFEQGLKRKTLENDLESNLRSGNVFMVYQPIYSVDSGDFNKVEALARWQHDKYGSIYPSEFIPLCESTGLMSSITRFAFESGISMHQAYQKTFKKRLTISINVSSLSLMSGNIITIVSEVFKDKSDLIQFFELEITEDVLMDLSEETLALIRSLKHEGFRIALDDFGIGFSNFEYLQKIEADTLKIDKKFVDGIVHDDKTRIVTHAIMDMAKTLGMEIVAEGVEFKEQYDLLEAWSCHYIQGYYLSKPRTSTDLLETFNHK